MTDTDPRLYAVPASDDPVPAGNSPDQGHPDPPYINCSDLLSYPAAINKFASKHHADPDAGCHEDEEFGGVGHDC